MALAGALTMDRVLRMNAPRLHFCLRSGTHSSSRLSRPSNNNTRFTRTFVTNPSRAQQCNVQRILPPNRHDRIPASPTLQAVASRPTKGRFTNHAGSSRTTPLLRCYSSVAASLSSESRHSHPYPAPALPTLDASSLANTIISQAPLQLSTEQQFLMQQVLHNKKSVFFTGSAGTGKSVLLRQLIENLKEHYKPGQVAVTASTGIAACNIGGCTLHAFAGIGLGNGTVDQLMVKLGENRRAKARWRKTKVLIIDEISMIDGDLFDKLDEIARRIKRSTKPFGGIQLIITGDFYQLPPVAGASPVQQKQLPTAATPYGSSITTFTTTQPISRTRASKSGSRSTTTIIKAGSSQHSQATAEAMEWGELPPFEYDHDGSNSPFIPEDAVVTSGARADAAQLPTLCFDAKAWKDAIPFTLQLTEVFRQRDPAFIKMLTEMRHGKLSEETCEVFRKLAREPEYPTDEDGIVATELFALKSQVEQANRRRLAQLPGPMYTYQPQDSGPLEKFMDRFCNAPTKLQIKQNAQVMLIKNLTPTLVNGSMGMVVGFQKEMSFCEESGTRMESHFPVVRFVGEEDDLVIKPQEWRMELPDGEVIGSRIQVPLILAWAMSIHKSQGQTMERLKVDMGKIFEAGQAYVALSRATSLDGLQVLNFDKRAVQSDERVEAFYNGLKTVQELMQETAESAGSEKGKGSGKASKKTAASSAASTAASTAAKRKSTRKAAAPAPSSATIASSD